MQTITFSFRQIVRTIPFLFLGYLISVPFISCNEPSLIGADQTDEDRLNVLFTDTTKIQAEVFEVPRIVGFDTISSTINGSVFQYAVGNLNDPVFGTTTAELSFQIRLNEVLVRPGELDTATIDSVVLGLKYEPNSSSGVHAFYGDTMAQQVIDVFLVTEMLNPRSNYFTDHEVMYDLDPVGSKGPFIANRVDSVRYTDLDSIERKVPAQLRIRLDNDRVGQEIINILQDSGNVVSSNFVKRFPGFHLKSRVENNSTIGFSMPSPFSELTIYYTVGSEKKRLDFPTSVQYVRAPYYEHDYSVGTIQPFIDDTTKSDSLCFVQGAAGILTRVRFPEAADFRGSLINKAELEITLADLPEDKPNLYGPIAFLISRLDNRDGTYGDVEDVARVFTWFRDFNSWTRLLGGEPKEMIDGTDTLTVYRLNITSFFQDVVDGKIDEDLVVYPFYMRQSPQRIVFYGPSHSKHPMRLRVSFTKP
jgi:hypothetical protein